MWLTVLVALSKKDSTLTRTGRPSPLRLRRIIPGPGSSDLWLTARSRPRRPRAKRSSGQDFLCPVLSAAFSTVTGSATPVTCAGVKTRPRRRRDGQRPLLRADHLPGLDQAVEDGPPRASVGQLTGRDTENLELRLALAEAGLPVHLGLDLR